MKLNSKYALIASFALFAVVAGATIYKSGIQAQAQVLPLGPLRNPPLVNLSPMTITACAGAPTAQVLHAGGAQLHDTVTYTIPFCVTNSTTATNYYIPKFARPRTTLSAQNAIQYNVDTTTSGSAVGEGIITYMGHDAYYSDANNNYAVAPGITKQFQLVVTYQPTQAIMTRASLINVNWNTNDDPVDYSIYNVDSASFKTPFVAAH